MIRGGRIGIAISVLHGLVLGGRSGRFGRVLLRELDGNRDLLCRPFGVIGLRSSGCNWITPEARADGVPVGFIRRRALYDTPHLTDPVVEAADDISRRDGPRQQSDRRDRRQRDGDAEP